ncbi:uncharacterized protein LOC131160140 [Malania oleifera]|uniref:uncharacterized protein LOC131160140 n=1 Tax=Malania oleifera TaxID=397392 RepID=UPI0025AE2530|nr:uncharacterized protein LOC131160140 [Malania oleifera]
MSLFLGNLSSRIRRDELERIFWRFGRCRVQLKDGYGFAVYEFPPNADKALRALRGKNICGEPVTLSWSNKQPRPFQRFARGARSYEPQYVRSTGRGEGYVDRKLGPGGRRDDKVGIKQPDSDDGRLISADMIDEEVRYHQNKVKDYISEKHHDVAKDYLDEVGNVDLNLADNDRWGQQVGEPSISNGVENGMEFDRYDPYHSHEKRDENENDQIIYSGGSPNLERPQERTGEEETGVVNLSGPDNRKPQRACYICGESGHKMRNCPRDNASRRKKFTRFDRRQDDELNFRGRGDGELERFHSTSRGGLPLSRNAVPVRQSRNDRKASGSGKHQRLFRSGGSLGIKESYKAARKDSGRKKRSRRENGTPKRPHAKKPRRSASSSSLSDYPASRSHSHSQSSRSMSRSISHSRSRSISSRTGSSPANSRSSSMSHYSRSQSFKSRSKSSSPTSLSLSVSLGRPLLSSPNKVPLNLKDSSDNDTTPESKEVLLEQRQPVEPNAAPENSKIENSMMMAKNENAMSSFKVEYNMDKDHPLQNDVNNICAASMILYEGHDASPPFLGKDAFIAGSLSPQSMKEKKELKDSSDMAMEQIPTRKLDSVVPLSSCIRNSTIISSEEMYMVVKHYGLEHPEENGRHLAVENYFGSARMWPWEIIYYRRLKKGPLSVENYARRIAQNREFGIVDKYVRSSSGWGELGQDNC